MMLLSYALFFLFREFHLTEVSAINQLLNNLIQFSGIFSAILITYVVSKVFQVRQERVERYKEIVKLANKFTDFRRIARVLVNNYGFWDKGMREKMRKEYEAIDYFTIKLWDYDNQDKKYSPELKALRDKFFAEESLPGCYMYLDMKALVLDDYGNWQLEICMTALTTITLTHWRFLKNGLAVIAEIVCGMT